jgi:hypothetical protein
MATSKEQWLLKLKGWVQSWRFENPEYQQAVFNAIAKTLSDAEIFADSGVTETFIGEASGASLDLHGSERDVTRIEEELDPSYSIRIRNFTNYSNRPAIKTLVDSLLIVGECTISEDYDSGIFADRESFTDRGQLMVEEILNSFSIILDNQTHSPYSFLDREYFSDREDFIGTIESPVSLFNAIVAAVNKVKAFGTLYRVYERSGA